MELKITPPNVKKERKTGGPYVSAVLNPAPAYFEQMGKEASRTILEIGCGVNPRISWKVNSGDLWVGADPAIKARGESIQVHKGLSLTSPDAKLVVFPDIVADIPKFQPDILLAVAPNQKDIVDGRIFDDQLEPFLSPTKRQTFLVLLDTRSKESLGYQGSAIKVISEWMRENKFVRTVESTTIDDFRLNSGDLGEQNIRMHFVRQP